MPGLQQVESIIAADILILQHDAYDKYEETILAGENLLNFTDLCGKMTAEEYQIIELIMTGNFLNYHVQWSSHGYSALTISMMLNGTRCISENIFSVRNAPCHLRRACRRKVTCTQYKLTIICHDT
ncbi:hypothetical protein MAR_009907 [Mya arenaria]|uniref:Uncharacterized protein n=1 Tax=Mya arenaria TaxID=6604 RepID=A0ABY7E4L6_MYAAR|nr:hypothetical protein MAR_009907 [Mya arenaria]